MLLFRVFFFNLTFSFSVSLERTCTYVFQVLHQIITNSNFLFTSLVQHMICTLFEKLSWKQKIEIHVVLKLIIDKLISVYHCKSCFCLLESHITVLLPGRCIATRHLLFSSFNTRLIYCGIIRVSGLRLPVPTAAIVNAV